MEDKEIIGLFFERDERAADETMKKNGARLRRLALGFLARLTRCRAFNLIECRRAVKRSVQLVELTNELSECIPDISGLESVIFAGEIYKIN